MLGNVVGFAEIFEDGRDFGFEALAENFSADVFVFVVTAGEDVERALAVAGLDAFEAIDFHFLEESSAFGEFVAEKRRVSVFGIDRLAAAHAPAETDDDDVGAAIGRFWGLRRFAREGELWGKDKRAGAGSGRFQELPARKK